MKMNDTPKVCVIMPVYNGEQVVRYAFVNFPFL